MIHLIYQDQNISIEEIYNQYPGPSDPDAFGVWFMKSLERNTIQYDNPKRMSKELYAKQCESDRKQTIRGQLVNTYLSTYGKINKKKRKALKDAYKKSEQYQIDFEYACQSDSILHSFSDQKIMNKLYADFIAHMKKKERETIKKQLSAFIEQKREEILQAMLTEEVFYQYENALQTSIKDQIETCLLTLTCISDYCLEVPCYYEEYEEHNLCSKKTESEEIEDFIEGFMYDPEVVISGLLYGESFLDRYLTNYFFQAIPGLAELDHKEAWEESFIDVFDYELHDFKMDLLEELSVSELFILKSLMKNPHYKDAALAFYEEKRRQKDFSYFSNEEIAFIKEEEEKRKKRIEKNLVSSIPKEYKDLYPLARQMKRKFILHIGPTNSGKTYQAMNRLRQGGSGIYLTPLRLLAYEQFEILNKEGFLCNLITGEEKNIIPKATFQSSTIELANLTAYYHFAVIDEAQMISDQKRGGAWTAALLGLCAEEIHVCAANYAKDILIRLIEECGDEYEIVQHTRDTLLSVEKETFHFPEDVREQDALIVFSKKNVHAVAAELQRKGRTCSIIYGNLPYIVRQEEAHKFLRGESQVIVATDAIGMGMNLPIHRVIFLETAKYDGHEKRLLKAEEIQQIAGRAGRKGIFESGLINCEEYKPLIARAIDEQIEPISYAVLRFPESLLGLDASLSEILEQWNNLKPHAGYKKETILQQLFLCRELETFTDHKRLIYDFITIPFDSNNAKLKSIWEKLFIGELNHRPFNYQRFLPIVYDSMDEQYLNILEDHYKVCDLLGFYMSRFHPMEGYEDISRLKNKISEQIVKILNNQKLSSKKCKNCGCDLPWNHPYGICEDCYSWKKCNHFWADSYL